LGTTVLFLEWKTASEFHLPFAFMLLAGSGSNGEAQCLAEGEGCPHEAQGAKDGEGGLD